MSTIKVELKNVPELKRLLAVAFPGYRKHNVYISAFREMNINSYWDGGSKDEYAVVELTTMSKRALPSSSHPFFDIARQGIQGENSMVAVSERGNITLKQLPENFALVAAGTFCGKAATAHIYFNEANMPKLLEASNA